MKTTRTKSKTRASRQASTGSGKQISFLPEPDFNPEVPEKNTVLYFALKLLIDGKAISHRDFDNVTNSYRLAAYILALKKMGWPISDYKITQRVSKNPRIRKYKCYYIEKNNIDKFRNSGGVL